MISPEKLLHIKPNAVNYSPAASKEAIVDLLTERIDDANMTPLIALPDIYGISPACQVASQYPANVDMGAWRINMVLLLGIAAHKSNTATSAHLTRDKTPTILGAHPSDILKEFFVPDFAERILVDDLKMPLNREYKRLLGINWISPDNCPRLLSKIKSIAEMELMHELYRAKEDAKSLNPKVAFLWGGITSWRAWHLSTEFRDWLADFRARAKSQIVSSLIEGIESGDQLAYTTLNTALNGHLEELQVKTVNNKVTP